MSDINNVIHKLINKQYDFCCLCFINIDEKVTYFEDEVVYFENQVQYTTKIRDILVRILGDQVFENLSDFKAICIQCATAAVTSFKFINECKENNQCLIKMVEFLNETFETFPDDGGVFRTLYVTLNPKLCTTNQYYDDVKCQNVKSALKRYYYIRHAKNEGGKKVKIQDRIKVTEEKLPKTKLKNEITHDGSTIKTKDMLNDKNDLTNIQCKECFASFQNFTYLRTHYLQLHAPKTFQCPECPEAFGSPGFLSAHKLESHNVGLVCSECGKVCNTGQSLIQHEKRHHLRLVCQVCGRVYKNHNTFKKHIDNQICEVSTRHSPADAKFECDYCHKKYTQKMTLRVHIQYEHGNYKYLDCKWCKKKFWCKSRLNAHIVKHTKERNFVCTICNGKFVTKESLLYHTRIHTGERPYKCPHCDNRFLNASRRAAHVKSQHMDPKLLQCDICQVTFKSYHYLTKHRELHKKSDKEIKLESDEKTCEICQAKFKSYQTLLKHQESHKNLNDGITLDNTVTNVSEAHLLEIMNFSRSNQVKINVSGSLSSPLNLGLEYAVTHTDNVELQSDSNRMQLVYHLNNDDSQGSQENQEIYLEIADGDIMKVSEDVEI